MTLLLSPDQIKAIVGECDDAQLERYQRVAKEAFLLGWQTEGCPGTLAKQRCILDKSGHQDCRTCWLVYFDRESQ
jgi:hypothetical protein